MAQAPPVHGDVWLNVDPLDLNDLRGQVVVVVFWSYGCEASLLRLRQVSALVDRVRAGGRGSLSALAVHSPRLLCEHDVHGLRSVVAQHEIALPIVHDPELVTWSRYNPEGWPATFVIDGRGRILGVHHGTGDADLLADSVTLALGSVPPPGAIGQPVQLTARPIEAPDSDLAFPTAVARLSEGELLVADFGHNRILVFELDDQLTTATAVAEIDGLDHPQSLAVDANDSIYVTEPWQGRVSYLDLRRQTRQMLTDDMVVPSGLAIDADGSLVITDAGTDKIYRIINNGPNAVTMGLIAGSGLLGSRDGAAGAADLAQPCGPGRTEAGVVFCDSASSNLRLLTDGGKVATITGSGLFQSGLVDGPAHQALLQRPSGLVVMDDGSLVVVDSGNSRLRRLASRRLWTLGLAGLNRPAGACALPSGHLVVADTGNHRLVVVGAELQTAWPLTLRGVLPPRDIDPRVAASTR